MKIVCCSTRLHEFSHFIIRIGSRAVVNPLDMGAAAEGQESDLDFGTGPHLLDDLDPKFQGGSACHDLLKIFLKICHA